MNEKGYILLSRSILDSDVFASQKLLKIWVWCLCKANFKDRSVPLKVGRGETIVKVKRGSFVFGRFKAEQDLFIDGSTIYKSIKKLEEMDMIKIESNNQYSIVTICKYNDYQDNNSYKVATKGQARNNQVTSKEQPSNTTNTLPNVKKDKNVNIKQDVYFTHETFVEWFNDCRKYIGLKSNIKRLSQYEITDFNELVKDYTVEDFKSAFDSFHKDEYYKDNNLIFPKYFLKEETFIKYLNTEVDDVKQTVKQNTGGDVNLW